MGHSLENMAERYKNYKRQPEEEKIETPKDKILIVDDNVALLEILCSVLEKTYDIVRTSDPMKVMDLINDAIVTVVLDIKMERKNGFEVAKEIQADYDVPIIFYTAFQNEKDYADIMAEYKPFSYIQKGSKPNELVNKIAEAVAYYHSRKNK